MSLLKVSSINDLTDTGGFSLSNGGVTATLPLVVGNIVINGAISGNSGHIIPRQAGNAEKLLQTDGSNLSWVEAAGLAGRDPLEYRLAMFEGPKQKSGEKGTKPGIP